MIMFMHHLAAGWKGEGGGQFVDGEDHKGVLCSCRQADCAVYIV